MYEELLATYPDHLPLHVTQVTAKDAHKVRENARFNSEKFKD